MKFSTIKHYFSTLTIQFCRRINKSRHITNLHQRRRCFFLSQKWWRRRCLEKVARFAQRRWLWRLSCLSFTAWWNRACHLQHSRLYWKHITHRLTELTSSVWLIKRSYQIMQFFSTWRNAMRHVWFHPTSFCQIAAHCYLSQNNKKCVSS